MKRSGFKRAAYEPNRPPVKAIPRDVSERIRYADARLYVEIPKTAYVRDKRLRAMCQSMACQHCGASGADWAHSNQSKHGKGRGIKASDIYVAALCWPCHSELDQGSKMTQDERVRMWDEAHRKTVAEASRLGLWPSDIPKPEGE